MSLCISYVVFIVNSDIFFERTFLPQNRFIFGHKNWNKKLIVPKVLHTDLAWKLFCRYKQMKELEITKIQS